MDVDLKTFIYIWYISIYSIYVYNYQNLTEFQQNFKNFKINLNYNYINN